MEKEGIHEYFQVDVNQFPHNNSQTGKLMHQFTFHEDGHGGLVKKIRYDKGTIIPWHWHHCGHGFYVLEGTLETNQGSYKPGDFVWFDAKTKQWHGAGDKEDAVMLFVTDSPCDMNYL